MTQTALFIPGLFVTPQSQKYAALKDAMPEYEWDILDFSPLYRKKFDYDEFLELALHKITNQKPHNIVTYSFGGQVYQNLVQQQKIAEAEKTVFIVPVGDFGNSVNGQKILSGQTKAEHIYKPIGELNAEKHISVAFFAHLSASGNRTKDQVFVRNIYTIAGSMDQDADPDIFFDFKKNNAAGHVMLRDDHRMTQNMPLVCSLTKSFLKHG